MSIELETGLPSIRLLQTYLRDKQVIEVKLVTGDAIVGTLAWQDPHCVCIQQDETTIVVWRTALVYVKSV